MLSRINWLLPPPGWPWRGRRKRGSPRETEWEHWCHWGAPAASLDGGTLSGGLFGTHLWGLTEQLEVTSLSTVLNKVLGQHNKTTNKEKEEQHKD